MVSSRGTINSLAQRIGYGRLFKPRSKRGVVMIYGDTGTRDSWFALSDSLHPDGEVEALADAGYPIGSIDMGTRWGNTAIQTDIDTLISNCSDIFGGLRVHLIGASAGGLTILNWARANPTKVRSLTLLIPVLDVQDVWDSDRAGFKAEITTTYGGRPGDAYNPSLHFSDYSKFPIHLFYSTTDTVTPLSITEAFIEGVGDNVVAENMGAQGHNWLLSPVWNAPDVLAFIDSHD